MVTTRLIERYLPIADLSEESTRERRSMTALPPIYYLHVWWARRPLVASRAAVLASILPEDADRDAFKQVLGIHGDAARGAMLLDRARRTGIRVKDPYGYDRAFKHVPSNEELDALLGDDRRNIVVLDATAGGGAIPLEAVRLGLTTFSNDLNPVASLIQRATIQYPIDFGKRVHEEYQGIATRLIARVRDSISDYVPQPHAPDEVATSFLWARTIACPYCSGKVPLSPNWKLSTDGTGVKIHPIVGSGPGDEGDAALSRSLTHRTLSQLALLPRGRPSVPIWTAVDP